MAALGGLLADYASDSDASEGQSELEADTEQQQQQQQEEERAEASTATATRAVTGNLLNALPKPKRLGKRLVRFTLPFDVELVRKRGGAEDDDDDSEEDLPKKRLKTTGKGSKLRDYLPPPKHSMGSEKLQDCGTEPLFPVPTTTFTDSSCNIRDPAPVYEPSNPSHAMEHTLADIATDVVETEIRADGKNTAVGFDQWESQQDKSWQALEPNEFVPRDLEGTSGSDNPQSILASVEGDQMLASALQEERDKAIRQGKDDPFAGLGIKFKEVKQEDLKYVDPSVNESSDPYHGVFGSSYASKLRAEAAPHKGSKFAKRKHQIGTLYHDVKMKELEMMANKAQGMKSKAETEAKYGWR